LFSGHPVPGFLTLPFSGVVVVRGSGVVVC